MPNLKMTLYLQIIPICHVKSMVFFEKREKPMNLISPGAVWGLILCHVNAATHILKGRLLYGQKDELMSPRSIKHP